MQLRDWGSTMRRIVLVFLAAVSFLLAATIASRQGAPWAHDICEVVAPLCDDLGWLLAAGGGLVVSVVLNALTAARTV
jgi:hypothetical protein